MKLTWFGETALRVHIGGRIVVIDADRAPGGVDGNELTSGADLIVRLDGEHSPADGVAWRPRPAQRLLDAEGRTRDVDLWSLGERAVLIDPDEDMPLLVVGGTVPELGRWAERAVVLLAGTALKEQALALVDASAPRLIGLAGSEGAVDVAIAAIRERLDGTGLVALEPGLAVEV